MQWLNPPGKLRQFMTETGERAKLSADYADYFWIVLKLAPVRCTSRRHAAQPQKLKSLLLFNLRNLRNLRINTPSYPTFS
jgi:hypothetical protein